MTTARSWRRVGLILVLVAPAGPAFAYTPTLRCNGNPVLWSDPQTTMFVSTTSFPVGSPWHTRFQEALGAWSDIEGSPWSFSYGWDLDGTHAMGNGVNEVYVQENLPSGVPATTISKASCWWFFGWHYSLTEMDMVFSNAFTWNSGTFQASNLEQPLHFGGAALHELGHVLGLGHWNGTHATMRTYYPGSGPFGNGARWQRWGNDRLGVRAYYPGVAFGWDVAASNLKKAPGGKSTQVYSPQNVARGSYTTIEYSLSNLGAWPATFDIGFYLSTNAVISNLDRKLATNYGASASPGASGTWSRTLLIPADVAPGTYWLGVLLDPNDILPEGQESNNGVPMTHSVVVY